MSRTFCYQCYKAKAACICGQLPKIDNRVNIIILQHPTETRTPRGSAIIAKLYLKNTQLWIGEDFSSHPQLSQLIEQYPASTAIVYPGNNTISVDDFVTNCASTKPAAFSATQLNLIFIDGNWRKAKKIWNLSSNLHALPCIRIYPEKPSNYRIRKTPNKHSLSTIEAIHDCLSRIENNKEKYKPLLNIFNNMIDFQIQKMGPETYQKNYK